MRRALPFTIATVAIVVASVGACAADPAADSGPDAGGSTSDGGSSGDGSPTAADGAPIFVDGGPPGIQFIGRFDARDGAGPKCAWAGCRILARFDGTTASVTLNEIDETWMDGAPSEWDVAIDDAWQPKLVTTAGTKTYPLATGLPPGPHKVELYKRTEAQNGVTQFLAFDFGGGTLLSPPPRSTRKIEIVGDSAPAGFGVEGVGYPMTDCPGLDYSAQWQNYRRSFGAVLGGLVSAEIHGTVYSGKGIVKNVFRPDTDPMPKLFPLANPIDFSSAYDFAWQPDAVILMIGGNDFAEGQPEGAEAEPGGEPATPEAFTAGYGTFVGTLRTRYPSAHLFLSASPSVSDAEPADRSSRTNVLNATAAAVSARAAAGDTKVYAFHPTVSPKSELTGCNGHGTPAFHDRVAAEYAVIVKQKLGW